MKKYIITITILLILIMVFIGGYFVYGNFKTNESNDVETLKQKCTAEIDYLSSNIIEIMNGVNNIQYSNYKVVDQEIPASESSSNSESSSAENTQQGNTTSEENTINSSRMVTDTILNARNSDTKWDELTSKVEEIYTSWTTIMIDLTSLNVNRDNLLKFNNTLDSITKSIASKDKSQTLINSADLYSLVSSYIKDFSGDNEKNLVYSVRANILYSYAYTESDDWQKVIQYIGNAKGDFSGLLNNQVNNVNKIDIINKSYILINELEQDANNNDKDVFLVNYANLMQELITI